MKRPVDGGVIDFLDQGEPLLRDFTPRLHSLANEG